jgi:ribonuclease D
MTKNPGINPTIHLHIDDLPDGLDLGSVVAVDSETMGLKTQRDRLCLVQLSSGDGICHLVHFKNGYDAPNLKKVLEDSEVIKIFHFARFDVTAFMYYLDAYTSNIFCTKIASKLVRTYTDRHGLKELCKEILNIEISKESQSSDWGHHTLSMDQQKYAATDVLYLHQIKDKLEEMLIREDRLEIAQDCFKFLPTRSILDLLNFEDPDIFQH